MEVQPLTHCYSSGVLYHRLPEVTAQIECALGLSTDDLLERTRISDADSPLFVKEESLVYLIRHFRRGGHDGVVGDLSAILIGRIATSVKSRLRVLGRDNLEDGFQDVIAGVFERILDLERDRGDFFQVRFWVGVQRLTITTFNKYKKQHDEDLEHEVAAASLPLDDDDGPLDRSGNPWEALPGPQLLPEQYLLVTDAVASISVRYRDAYILHNIMRFQVESLDPNEPTVSTMLGKTSRTIRNWLVRAEEQLENWQNDL